MPQILSYPCAYTCGGNRGGVVKYRITLEFGARQCGYQCFYSTVLYVGWGEVFALCEYSPICFLKFAVEFRGMSITPTTSLATTSCRPKQPWVRPRWSSVIYIFLVVVHCLSRLLAGDLTDDHDHLSRINRRAVERGAITSCLVVAQSVVVPGGQRDEDVDLCGIVSTDSSLRRVTTINASKYAASSVFVLRGCRVENAALQFWPADGNSPQVLRLNVSDSVMLNSSLIIVAPRGLVSGSFLLFTNSTLECRHQIDLGSKASPLTGTFALAVALGGPAEGVTIALRGSRVSAFTEFSQAFVLSFVNIGVKGTLGSFGNATVVRTTIDVRDSDLLASAADTIAAVLQFSVVVSTCTLTLSDVRIHTVASMHARSVMLFYDVTSSSITVESSSIFATADSSAAALVVRGSSTGVTVMLPKDNIVNVTADRHGTAEALTFAGVANSSLVIGDHNHFSVETAHSNAAIFIDISGTSQQWRTTIGERNTMSVAARAQAEMFLFRELVSNSTVTILGSGNVLRALAFVSSSSRLFRMLKGASDFDFSVLGHGNLFAAEQNGTGTTTELLVLQATTQRSSFRISGSRNQFRTAAPLGSDVAMFHFGKLDNSTFHVSGSDNSFTILAGASSCEMFTFAGVSRSAIILSGHRSLFDARSPTRRGECSLFYFLLGVTNMLVQSSGDSVSLLVNATSVSLLVFEASVTNSTILSTGVNLSMTAIATSANARLLVFTGIVKQTIIRIDRLARLTVSATSAATLLRFPQQMVTSHIILRDVATTLNLSGNSASTFGSLFFSESSASSENNISVCRVNISQFYAKTFSGKYWECGFPPGSGVTSPIRVNGPEGQAILSVPTARITPMPCDPNWCYATDTETKSETSTTSRIVVSDTDEVPPSGTGVPELASSAPTSPAQLPAPLGGVSPLPSSRNQSILFLVIGGHRKLSAWRIRRNNASTTPLTTTAVSTSVSSASVPPQNSSTATTVSTSTLRLDNATAMSGNVTFSASDVVVVPLLQRDTRTAIAAASVAQAVASVLVGASTASKATTASRTVALAAACTTDDPVGSEEEQLSWELYIYSNRGALGAAASTLCVQALTAAAAIASRRGGATGPTAALGWRGAVRAVYIVSLTYYGPNVAGLGTVMASGNTGTGASGERALGALGVVVQMIAVALCAWLITTRFAAAAGTDATPTADSMLAVHAALFEGARQPMASTARRLHGVIDLGVAVAAAVVSSLPVRGPACLVSAWGLVTIFAGHTAYLLVARPFEAPLDFAVSIAVVVANLSLAVACAAAAGGGPAGDFGRRYGLVNIAAAVVAAVFYASLVIGCVNVAWQWRRRRAAASAVGSTIADGDDVHSLLVPPQHDDDASNDLLRCGGGSKAMDLEGGPSRSDAIVNPLLLSTTFRPSPRTTTTAPQPPATALL